MVTRGAPSAVFALSPRALSRRGRRAAAAAAAGPATGREERRGCWYRVSRFVMRRPVTVLIGTLVPLLLVGAPFLQANCAIADYRSLPEDLAPAELAGPTLEAD